MPSDKIELVILQLLTTFHHRKRGSLLANNTTRKQTL